MADTGILKPSLKPLVRAGFLWGFVGGAVLILNTWWFENSRFSVTNHLVANLTRLFWDVLILPAAIIGPFLGIDLQLHPDLAGVGDVLFMMVADGVVFGLVGAFVGWRVAVARFRAEFPQPSESEEMLDKGIPPWSIYCQTIRRRCVWGGLVGFIVNLVVLGISVPASGGHSITGLIMGFLSVPTYALGNWLVGWPKSDTQFTLSLVLIICVVNAVLIALLCICVTAATEIWLFFRNRR